MAFGDPCAECGVKWGHKRDCSAPAAAFVTEFERWGRAMADDDPRCPKCGVADDEWIHGAPRNASDGSVWKTECVCGHEYEIEMVVSYHFRVTRDDRA